MLNDLGRRHLSGRNGGQVDVCSAHPLVLAAAAAGEKDDVFAIGNAALKRKNGLPILIR